LAVRVNDRRVLKIILFSDRLNIPLASCAASRFIVVCGDAVGDEASCVSSRKRTQMVVDLSIDKEILVGDEIQAGGRAAVSCPGNDRTYRFPLIVETLVRLRLSSCIIDSAGRLCEVSRRSVRLFLASRLAPMRF
jgi:hypothetical protein